MTWKAEPECQFRVRGSTEEQGWEVVLTLQARHGVGSFEGRVLDSDGLCKRRWVV